MIAETFADYNRDLSIGDVVTHFKRNLPENKDKCKENDYMYVILNVAIDATSENTVVVYQSLYDDNIWVRPMEEFCSLVGNVYRFERCSDNGK